MAIEGPTQVTPSTPAIAEETNDPGAVPGQPAAPTMPNAATMEAVWALALQNAMSLGEEAVKQAQEAEKDDEEFNQ